MASTNTIVTSQLSAMSLIEGKVTPPGQILEPNARKHCDQDALARAQAAETDVIFEVHGKGDGKVTFTAHRMVLAHESEVFNAMFFGPLIGDSRYKKMISVKIDDAEPDVFQELLKYIYQKKISLSPDNALHLLFLSNKYMMYELKEACFEFLELNLDPDNFCIVLDACQVLNEPDFQERLLIYYRLNAPSILRCKSFLELSKGALQKLVEMDTVNVKELELYEACCRWAENRAEKLKTKSSMEKDIVGMFGKTENKTQPHLPGYRQLLGEKIIRNIRFPSMSKNDFSAALNIASVLDEQEIRNIKYAINTRIIREGLDFSMQPRKEFCEICANRSGNVSEVKKLIDNYLNETILMPLSNIFLTAIKVLPKKGYNYVQLEMRILKERGEMSLASASGRIDSEAIRFNRPIKAAREKMYIILVKYDQIRRTDGDDARPVCEKKRLQKVKLEEAFFFMHLGSSAISSLYYHVL